MRMTQDNVLIKLHQRAEVTRGGIVLPDEKQLRDEPKGVVVAAGPKVRELRAGDEVVFGTWAGQAVTLKGVEHIILKEGDVLAKEC